MSESRTEKAVPAGNPGGCFEGASAGGTTRDQGARNAAKGGDYRPIGRHQERLDPSVPVGTGGPWQAWAGKAGREKDDAHFGTCPFATRCSASGRQGEDGLPGPTSWPLWRCERTGDQGGAKRQRARTFANVPRLLCSLALLGRSDRGAAARRSPVGIASTASALCSHKAGCTCLALMCGARRGRATPGQRRHPLTSEDAPLSVVRIEPAMLRQGTIELGKARAATLPVPAPAWRFGAPLRHSPTRERSRRLSAAPGRRPHPRLSRSRLQMARPQQSALPR